MVLTVVVLAVVVAVAVVVVEVEQELGGQYAAARAAVEVGTRPRSSVHGRRVPAR